MGHALVAASLPDVDPVLKVSIIPRGVGALGYTIQRPTEDRFVLAGSELRHRIAVLMGGRAAEVLIFEGDASTGAADDLQRATQIAQEMVTRYGMTQAIGQRIYAHLPPSFLNVGAEERPNASETTMREIDLSVRDIVAQAFDEAQAILVKRRSDLDKGAELLLAKEVLTADEFPALRRAEASPGSEKKVA
jgi:cell division protease FtsH